MTWGTITPSDVGLGNVQLKPKKLAAPVTASNELLMDSNPAARELGVWGRAVAVE